jgi:hypothetical protein
MTKHVLVLCQRKTGTGVSATGVLGRVEEMVVPKINDFVKSKLGDDVSIEYLTDGGGQKDADDNTDGTADHNHKLIKNSGVDKIDTFIREHTGYYSLIILNTCPYISMDYQLIYDLLTPDGMMAFTKYPAPPFQRRADGSLVDVLYEAKDNVAELFEDTGIYYYKKLSQKKRLSGGNKQKRKSKNTKKRNRRNKKLSVRKVYAS